MMRTTITIEDDDAAVARHYADTHDVTLGQAISILIRRAHIQAREPVNYPVDFEPFPGSPDSPIITTDFVNELLDETL